MGDLYICKLFFKILFSAHVFFYDNSLGLSFFFCDIRIFMHFCQGEREEGVVDVDDLTNLILFQAKACCGGQAESNILNRRLN